MNLIDVAKGIVFKKMGVNKDTFEDRLICQKKVYLLQSLGTDLGYSYNWYVRGPYSPSLANYLFLNLDVLENLDYSHYKISENAEDNIKTINNLVDDDRKKTLSDAQWYELLASLLYIKENKVSWKIDGTDTALFDALRKLKPLYTVEQCRSALEVLALYGFIKDTVKNV